MPLTPEQEEAEAEMQRIRSLSPEANFRREAELDGISLDEAVSKGLNDLLITAVEGGTGYWGQVRKYNWRFYDADPRNPVTVEIQEEEDGGERPGEWIKVVGNDPEWKVAAEKAAMLRKESLYGFLEDHDAESADLAMQYFCFGKVIYG